MAEVRVGNNRVFERYFMSLSCGVCICHINEMPAQILGYCAVTDLEC